MLDTNMEETVSDKSKIVAQDVRVLYGDKEALRDVNIRISEKMVTAFIGPSGCGKSTFLRCFNRMND
ncbi:MAG: ATP-binding cassette domain-containing protein, partial [Paracoccaceae bacterium]